MAPVFSVVVASASVAALATQPTFRASLVAALVRFTGYNTPGGLWRIAAILFALANLKNLPFVWHIRVLRAIAYQVYLQPTPIPPHGLFQPMVTRSRAPLLEVDYNMHKSNSTYFSDLDVSRSHLFTAIIRNAIHKNSKLNASKAAAVAGVNESGSSGKHIVALGGISCHFKREIPPYAPYEMWTRVLSWDRKWFYLVTHMVKPGVGKPTGWSLQPWRKSKHVEGEEIDKEKLMKAVYASSIAKYVIKKGRLTVSPERVLWDADMVPKKEEGWVYAGEAIAEADGDSGEVLPKAIKAEDWNWDTIERERLRGLKIAQKFADLDGMHDFFDGGKEGALGEFADLF